GFARAALQANPVAGLDAALLRVVRMNLEHVLVVPAYVRRAPRLRSDVVLAEDAAGRQEQREHRRRALIRRHVRRDAEESLAADELLDVHRRGAFLGFRIARPLDAAELVELLVADAGEGRREPC